MEVIISRYPESGGTVSYSIRTDDRGIKWLEFSIAVNSGHVLKYVSYSKDGMSSPLEDDFQNAGPSLVYYRPQIPIQDDSADHYLSVYFDDYSPGTGKYNLTILTRVSPAAGGRAYASPDSFTNVPVGAVSTFKLHAIANAGYVFDHWERVGGTATSTANPWKRTASPDEPGSSTRTYRAYFRTAQTRTITATVDPTGGGLVNGVETYTENFVEGSTSSVSLTAEPATGYVFDHWEREFPTYKSVYTRSFVAEATTNERWIAIFTNNPSYISTLKLRIHPAKSDHGRHGQVSVKLRDGCETTYDDDAEIKFMMANNEPFVPVDVVVLSYLDKTFAKLRTSYTGTVHDIEEGVEKSVKVGYNGSIDVFFGCGKILHSKEDNKILHHVNNIVHCG